MNFLKKTSNWSTGQLWIFKWGVFTAGILTGSYFGSYLKGYIPLLWFMSIVCCLSAAYFWLTKKKS